MKMRTILLAVNLAFSLAMIASFWMSESALAQGGCTDATGNPIPCPGQEKKTPTPIPPPTATSTPLPVANPAEDGSTEVGWSGSCSGSVSDITTCIGKLAASCESSKGSYDIKINTDGSHTLTCTLPLLIEPTPLPLANPPEGGDTGGTTVCQGNYQTCLKFVAACERAGGTVSTSNADAAGVPNTYTCTIAVFVDPTPFPFAAPEDDHIGSCNAADGNLQECLDEYQRQCTDGLLVVKVDIYNGQYDIYCIPHEEDAALPIVNPGGGDPTAGNEDWDEGCSWATCWLVETSCWLSGGKGSTYEDGQGGFYVSCDMPSDDDGKAFPPGGWFPWTTGFLGLLIGMILPAIQKVRDAAARSRMPNNKNPELMKNRDQEEAAHIGSANGGVWKNSDTEPRTGSSTPQTREHVLLAKQPEGPSKASTSLGDSADDIIVTREDKDRR